MKTTLFKLAPSAILIGIFSLGFLGKAEDSPWLNSSQLWQKGDPFFWEGSRALASPYFLFRGRPNSSGKWHYYGVNNHYSHNELGLRDDPILEPKPDTSFRILNLGDSATWGLSLPGRKHSYTDRLEELLNTGRRSEASPTYDVINAGSIGYSSWQTLRWLEFYIDALKPDLVTVYIGNNDSAPGGISDAQRGSVRFGSATRILSRNAFYLLLQKAWLNFGKRSRDEKRERFLANIRKPQASMTKEQWYESVARVSPRDYEANLRGIVEVARERGARVLLLKVPMNFVWPRSVTPTRREVFDREYWSPLFVDKNYLVKGLRGRAPCDTPFSSHPWLCMLSVEQIDAHLAATTPYRDAAHFIAEQESWRAQAESDPLKIDPRIHQLAVVYIAQGMYAKAAETLRSLTDDRAFAPEHAISAQARAEINHALGVALLLDGQREEARIAFVRSREIFPFATSYEYYDAFDRVAKELAVDTIDLPALFEQRDPDYFGSSLMHDWVHPSPDGNEIIARALADQIANPVSGFGR